jgi:hypothetical protein
VPVDCPARRQRPGSGAPSTRPLHHADDSSKIGIMEANLQWCVARRFMRKTAQSKGSRGSALREAMFNGRDP